MNPTTLGKARDGRSEPGPRTDVHVMRAEDAPLEWWPTLRLFAQLAEMFGDQIIDIEEVPPIDSQSQED